MFLQPTQPRKERIQGIRMADKMLDDVLNSLFETEYPNLREEVISGGISPDKADDFLKECKRDMKLELIRIFKEKIEQIKKQKIAHSSSLKS